MVPYNYGHFASFLIIINCSTLLEVLLNVLTNIFSEISTVVNFLMPYYALPSFSYKKISVYFFFKNLMVMHGNALKLTPICVYFSEDLS